MDRDRRGRRIGSVDVAHAVGEGGRASAVARIDTDAAAVGLQCHGPGSTKGEVERGGQQFAHDQRASGVGVGVVGDEIHDASDAAGRIDRVAVGDGRPVLDRHGDVDHGGQPTGIGHRRRETRDPRRNSELGTDHETIGFA